MEIVTRRLFLRPLRTSDLETTHEYASDTENTRYMMFLPNETREETVEFLKNAEQEWKKECPGFYEFAVLKDGMHIGAISLYLDEKREEAEFGWILHKNHWRRGYTYEAASALLDYAYRELGIRHFIACCDSENVGSYKVMEKLGMQRISCSGGRKNRGSEEERKELMYELWLPA